MVESISLSPVGVGYSGSYAPEDVTFLMTLIDQEFTMIDEKERLIQSGRRHYSELLGREHSPSAHYLKLFEAAVARNGERLALDICALADHVVATRVGGVCVVSLARAGTPIGVLLRRALERRGRSTRHVSISIIAGRGIDVAALDHIRNAMGVADEEIVFVDGWTGKGTIADALRAAVVDYNANRGAHIDSTLHVLTDLCGRTVAAATTDDSLIPSCLLGATVSGLVSRSVLNDAVLRRGSFHGCRTYPELAAVDRSRAFVDAITSQLPLSAPEAGGEVKVLRRPARDLESEQVRARESVDRWCARLSVPRANVKVGIGEATRVLLRRLPGRLILRDPQHPDVVATRVLADEKGVDVDIDTELPWAALAVIERVT